MTEDCEDGLMCLNGVCTLPCSRTFAVPGQAIRTSTCFGGVCANNCVDKRDCPNGLTCVMRVNWSNVRAALGDARRPQVATFRRRSPRRPRRRPRRRCWVATSRCSRRRCCPSCGCGSSAGHVDLNARCQELLEGGYAPYWAFCWASGQALARHVLDHPELVRGKRVVDFGAGSAVVAIAAARAGAREVVAVDSDPRARRFAAHNAALNGVALAVSRARAGALDLMTASDVLYEPEAARCVLAHAERRPRRVARRRASPGHACTRRRAAVRGRGAHVPGCRLPDLPRVHLST